MAFTDLVFLTVRSTLYLFLKVWHRYEIRGAEHIPAQGGCLIAANHVSFLDPAAVSCGTGRRKTWFLARDTLFSGHSWFFRALHCIPLNRENGEIGAIRKSIQMLREGQMLALFPEGTRSRNGELQQGHRGIGLIVSKAQVPVVPSFVEGTYNAFTRGSRWIRPCRIRVTYGRPITTEEVSALGTGRGSQERIAKLVMDRIAALAVGTTV